MQKTNGGDFIGAKSWVFGFEINDELAHIRREAASFVWRRCMLFGKQARHAMVVKLVSLMLEGSFTGSSFFCSFCCRLSKQDDWPEQLIGFLFWPKCMLFNMLPVMRSFSAYAFASGHGIRSRKQDGLTLSIPTFPRLP